MSVDIKDEITFEEFMKLDLRVATVLKAETIPRAKNLLKLKVDIGEERTIIAGIRQGYNPDDLLGKQIIIVANLKPRKIMGEISKGMLLAAVDKDICALATLDKEVKSGIALS